ncbi:hypothetical protein Y032_0167g152 [Ancylostoma ceylanicum]|uniref:Uncharacterized protein n=1 Tax=Ancylostoma ceylanicum TaxID=53326 RepID=A0A016SVT5_9BILA|nr:hypothetical protein Y032_0167g152 [Ancylostoma ceylanicum]
MTVLLLPTLVLILIYVSIDNLYFLRDTQSNHHLEYPYSHINLIDFCVIIRCVPVTVDSSQLLKSMEDASAQSWK